MNNSEFIVDGQGKAAVPHLPHSRKALVEEQDLELDKYGLEETQKFVRQTMPLLDPEKVLACM